MTKGQIAVLFILAFMILGVAALIAVALLNENAKEAASPVPAVAILPTHTAMATRPPFTPTPIIIPPTWTPEPTRTPYPTNTPRATDTATPRPSITPTFPPTWTPIPTEVVTPSLPVLTGTLGILQNPGFDGIEDGTIPGWKWEAEDNFTPGGDYDPETSLETPLIKTADDPLRQINEATLQIDAVEHLKFRVHVFQTVPVSPTSKIEFQVLAGGFSDTGVIQIAAGIDPNGNDNCDLAIWSDIVPLNQETDVQTIVAPSVKAGRSGKVTVCLYAEPLYSAISNAAFFDDAELVVETK